MKKMDYINHTGGAKGADMFWETEGEKYGVKSISYSFKGHGTKSKSVKILTDQELMEGWDKIGYIAPKMGRDLSRVTSYVQNLLSRNWYQVKNSKSILAIGYLMPPGYKDGQYVNPLKRHMVQGGTGYAVELAIHSQFKANSWYNHIDDVEERYNMATKKITVFNLHNNAWYDWQDGDFKMVTDIPQIFGDFAGIGTRDLNEKGKQAIINVYKETFENDNWH